MYEKDGRRKKTNRAMGAHPSFEKGRASRDDRETVHRKHRTCRTSASARKAGNRSFHMRRVCRRRSPPICGQ